MPFSLQCSPSVPWPQAQNEAIGFTVRIENISTAETLITSDGTVAVPLAPGVWVLHQDSAPLFLGGEADRGQGLEGIAEDGTPAQLAEYLAGNMMEGGFGVFNTPVGADGPGPLLPGGVYEFNFEAKPGYFLSFATMFVQSNDLFYAPAEEGIALFDSWAKPSAVISPTWCYCGTAVPRSMRSPAPAPIRHPARPAPTSAPTRTAS